MPTREDLSPELQAELAALETAGPGQGTDDAFKHVPGSGAIQGRFYREFKPVKRAVSIRLDADVLAYFEKDGPGYQTRINNVLRMVMTKERETA